MKLESGFDMGRYAKTTEVSSDKSKMEIERTLSRYGASQFMYGWQESGAMVGFVFNKKMIRFVIGLPDKNDFQFTDNGRTRSPNSQEKAYEQAVRQKWRALALVIKAKLEAVESGITTFEAEFMAHIVLPDNQTVADVLLPEIENSYLTGDMPKMLPMPKGEEK